MSDRLKMVLALSEKLVKELKEAEKNASDVKVKRALAMARANLQENEKAFRTNDEVKIYNAIIGHRVTAAFAAIWAIISSFNIFRLSYMMNKYIQDTYRPETLPIAAASVIIILLLALTIFFIKVMFNSVRDSIQLASDSGKVKIMDRLIDRALNRIRKYERLQSDSYERETKEFRDLVR